MSAPAAEGSWPDANTNEVRTMGQFNPAPNKLDGAYTTDDGRTHSHFHTHNDGSWGWDIYNPDGTKDHVRYLDKELNDLSTQPVNQW